VAIVSVILDSKGRCLEILAHPLIIMQRTLSRLIIEKDYLLSLDEVFRRLNGQSVRILLLSFFFLYLDVIKNEADMLIHYLSLLL
jgi:hypothetical protein